MESGFSGLFLRRRSSRLGFDSLRRNLAWSSHGWGKSKRLENGMLAEIKWKDHMYHSFSRDNIIILLKYRVGHLVRQYVG